MSVKEIDLVSFRNHAHINLKLGEGLNVIYGENGSGKTSILEAIYSLSLGRSFRTSKIQELVKTGEEFLSVKGIFMNSGMENILLLNQTSEGRRKIIRNGAPLKGLKDLVGHNPMVLVSPEEQKITQGSPAERRTYFDRLFSEIRKNYIIILSDFARVLKQRNAAIQRFRENRCGKNEIMTWNQQFIDLSKKLWLIREDIHSTFSIFLKKVVDQYSEGKVKLESQYLPSGDKNEFENSFKNNLETDIRVGRTMSGPHRDNYDFFFQGKDIRQFGSQGEHKLSLVLLKLAEFLHIHEETGKQPVLLLDDLFSKLDFQRSDDLLGLLKTGAQTIITTTDLVDIKRHKIDLDIEANKTFHLVRENAGTKGRA